MIVTVPVVFQVGLVVLLLVTHQVFKGVTIVRGDKVDTGVGQASAVFVKIAGTGEAVGKLADNSAIALPVGAHRVAVLAVPFGPAHGKITDLVTTLAQVPGLGDELHLRQHRVLVNDVEEGAEPVDLVQFARQRRGQIETETIHVHLQHPITQAVHDQLQYPGMHHVEGVAATGEVHVVARVLGAQAIVGLVVDAAEGQRRTEVIALGGMVVDHVEDHLDAGGVQALDQGLEFADMTTLRITHVGRKVTNGVIAPVIAQALFHQMPVHDETVHRHELDRRDTEALEVVDGRLGAQTRIGALQRRRHVRMQHGKTLDVQLVDDGVVPGRARWPVVAPGEGRVDDLALGHARPTVTPVEGQVGVFGAELVAEMGIAPIQIADDGLGVGIKQQLVGVETQSFLGCIASMYAITVQNARPDPGQITVPDMIGLPTQGDAMHLAPALGIKQTQFHTLGALREQGEVHALPIPGGPQRIGTPGPDCQ